MISVYGHATIEPVEGAETRWLAHVDAVAQRTIYFGCNSWYLGANIPGKTLRLHAACQRLPGVRRALRGGGRAGV